MLVGLWKCLIILSPRQECTGSGSSKSNMEVCISGCVFSSLVYELENSRGDVVSGYYWLVYKYNVLHLSLFDNFVLGRTFIRRNQQPNCQHRHRFTIRKLETWTSGKLVFFGSRCCLIDIIGNFTLFNYHFQLSSFQLSKDLCLLVKSIGKFRL